MKTSLLFRFRRDRDPFNRHILHGFVVRIGFDFRDRVHNIYAFDDLAEHRVRTRQRFLVKIKVGVVDHVDEPLATAGVRATVRHGDRPSHVATGAMELVLNHVPGSAGAVALRASALDHELRDHPVEDEPVVEPFVRELDEILGGLWRLVLIQLDDECSFCRLNRCFSIYHISPILFLLIDYPNTIDHNIS